MTTALAPPVLTDAQRVLLAEAIEEAVYARISSGDCTACDGTPDLCGDHSADLEKAVAWRMLAADLGLDQPGGTR